ncbi:hypothetical protein PGAG_00180 [Phaeocystis globosa virus 12T]|uniref:Uncharacterized protein n=1 Tax=Phaeocystis globosa virus PgV-16T TaxID=3071227 RepID=A0AC59EX46_9VIRU|nr:hypothetical protein PGCG_00221 [Phaeocystis globosa virus]AET73069.1 hypothetical protein PGAG_00180 [Phaeocystis globosa virus 12T]AET73892.1 hypothetical protein PGBG_00184 [Phaeocystis globosa virus 14T]AGM15532.1 hypothetical protein PGCG_00221 [Phaeocystis globosa virus PgV-16T]UYE94262.1 hypothetical protein PGV14T_00221 [Phaeocystis globosa virus]
MDCEKEEKKFTCGCGKQYKHNRSLWSHKKKCNYEEPVCVEIKKPTDVLVVLMDRLDKKDKQLIEQEEKNKEHTETLNMIQEMAELLMAADTKNKLLKDKIVEIEDEMTHNNKTQSTQFNNLFEKYIELQETNKSLEDMLSKAHN